jgi:uncharacterized membrane protein
MDIRMSLLAGVPIGFFFVLIHRASTISVLWPIFLLRIMSIVILFILGKATKNTFIPPRNDCSFLIIIGVLDVAGNVFFILAARSGRLDIATVISSLYPGSTIVLAYFLLHEYVSRGQKYGLALALVAIIMILI